ncbi:uncharacterized protein LOC126613960 [Malus sylvestris]|uniref:uncharacterized protein LOC126613960 n=1 Tax=Malus sylvestris TaxID=3752 RepID=UPI0021AC5EFA|nr:uncharacterized protein LOC126613960 [Malus sylvestris]
MIGMYSHGESSNAGSQHGQTFNGNYGGLRFYPGESSNAGAQQGQNFNGGSFGFVGQNQRSNGNGQANISQQFHSNRNNGNSQRYNSRSRFNGGNGFHFGSTNRGNGYGNSGGNFQNKGGSNWSTWTGNSGQKSAIIPECQICNKRGHTAPNCYYRNEQQSQAPAAIPECQICGKKRHIALNCFHRSNYAYQGANPPPTLIAMTAQSQSTFNLNQAWIMDTGATHHMTGDINDLEMIAPFEGDQKITVGNGKCLPVKNTGQGNKGNPNERKE